MRVYIAGPYTKPNPEVNVANAIFMGDWVKALGHSVYIPHLTHFWEKQIHHDYEFWMQHDLEWMDVCDAILRLPGESTGADREVQYARDHGKQVFHSIYELITIT